ncbi:S1C family serine protease [Haloprofundus salilacus]|uniref:S1C family serine protease n=1 Tax=Haloprofundus salilacus TaxID=2876190 RepID=UPI001CCFCA0F|nr:trypsin-like peptidase domain-containing protein [Haloprofundus salilacus]
MKSDIDYEQLYEEVIPSVVSVYTAGRGPMGGAGSGFVYDRHHVVTNEHVVRSGDVVELRFSDSQWREGEVIGVDAYTDLAVIRVGNLPEAALALPVATENPKPGRPVAALGNPMGLDGSISVGIVSGSNRSMPTSGGFAIPDVVQTDAPINPGNSGGPLVALNGRDDFDGAKHEATDDRRRSYEVVGVNRARQGDNIGFAVSPAIVSRVVPGLIEDGFYRHSYLRTRTLDVTPTVARANRLDEPRGVLVVDVAAGPTGGDALRGSRYTRTVRGQEVPVGGDVIVGINGRAVNSHEQLMHYLITETRPSEPVEIDVLRDGDEVTLEVVLGERPTPGDRRSRRSGRGERIPID